MPSKIFFAVYTSGLTGRTASKEWGIKYTSIAVEETVLRQWEQWIAHHLLQEKPPVTVQMKKCILPEHCLYWIAMDDKDHLDRQNSFGLLLWQDSVDSKQISAPTDIVSVELASERQRAYALALGELKRQLLAIPAASGATISWEPMAFLPLFDSVPLSRTAPTSLARLWRRAWITLFLLVLAGFAFYRVRSGVSATEQKQEKTLAVVRSECPVKTQESDRGPVGNARIQKVLRYWQHDGDQERDVITSLLRLDAVLGQREQELRQEWGRYKQIRLDRLHHTVLQDVLAEPEPDKNIWLQWELVCGFLQEKWDLEPTPLLINLFENAVMHENATVTFAKASHEFREKWKARIRTTFHILQTNPEQLIRARKFIQDQKIDPTTELGRFLQQLVGEWNKTRDQPRSPQSLPAATDATMQNHRAGGGEVDSSEHK